MMPSSSSSCTPTREICADVDPLSETTDSGDDVSFAQLSLSSHKSLHESLSTGSTQTDDSFIMIDSSTNTTGNHHDEDDDSIADPYLSEKPRLLSKEEMPPLNRSNTIPTVAESASTSFSSPSLPFEPPTSLRVPTRLPIAPSSSLSSRSSSIVSVSKRRNACIIDKRAARARSYWVSVVHDGIKAHGKSSVFVARALIWLGNAQMSCRDYVEASHIFKSAARIFRHVYHDGHLSVARALDKVGVACCRSHDLEISELALLEAFEIRLRTLGGHHVDTVDTLNNLAGVYLHLSKYRESFRAYWEVMQMRRAIFGSRHPSVAITAHSLGGVAVKMGELQHAGRYYRYALVVYRQLNLSVQHPTMRRLAKDIATLERLESSLGEF